jgi:hypothetical protein
MPLRICFLILFGCALRGETLARVEGHVLDQAGQPVRKATVRLTGNPPPVNGRATRSTTYVEVTDANGAFTVDQLAPGSYILSAQKPGYTPVRNGTAQFPNFNLAAGQVKKDTEVRLVQQGVISGRVMDRDGDPVVGAQVQALHVQYNGARRLLTPSTTASTDDQGNFRIANVEPGRYYPMVDDTRRVAGFNIAGDERRGPSAQETDIATYYPNSPDFSGAVAVDVGAGREAQGINIRMLKGRVYSARGKVIVGKNGAQIQASLTFIPKSAGIAVANGRLSTPVQQSGIFEVHGLLPGTYTVQAQQQTTMMRSADGGVTSTSTLGGRTELIVGNNDVDNLLLTLNPLPEITGIIRTEDGRPFSANGGRITLTDAEEVFGGSPSALINPDGTFKLQNVQLTRYAVIVNPLGQEMYVKSIRFGGQDGTKAPIDMTSGAGGVMDIVVSTKAAQVSATVHPNNNEIVSGLPVSLWLKSPGALDPVIGRFYRTGPDGVVKLVGVPPGEYYIGVWEDVDANLIRYPDFLSKFNDSAQLIRLAEGDKVTADLTVIPKTKIAAEVAKLP